ncbi:MAG: cytochrome c biogenesis CcdA family protein [Candidatus Dormibacteria bacterium]
MIPVLAIHLSYPLAFLAGLASFLSPCVFPLLPAYVAYLGGRVGDGAVGTAADGDARVASRRTPVIANGLVFVLGFSAVFVLFFYVFSALDVSLLRSHRQAVNVVSGIIVIALALEVLGVLHFGFLMRERRFSVTPGGSGLVRSFVLGLTFAAGWTPCIGPQLTGILSVASQHDFAGLPVMVVYCAGLGVPFLVAAVLTDRLQGVIRAVNRHMGIINLAGGALLLVFGLLLVSDHLTFLTRFGTASPVDL